MECYWVNSLRDTYLLDKDIALLVPAVRSPTALFLSTSYPLLKDIRPYKYSLKICLSVFRGLS